MTFAETMAADALEFRSLAGECAKLADGIGDTRGDLRKLGAASGVLTSLASVEATVRELADRLDRLASAPVPLCLASIEAAGVA